MKYLQATSYTLHTMQYFVAPLPGTTPGVQRLAELQRLPPTYLSKLLTKLVKVPARFFGSIVDIKDLWSL